ncbi:MAG TPA: ABC transporter substrate-binding protein [Gaiellaceae bacterium]|nr:ABC transporter substrate-binding protein [Gaiellaceae bacterium]
MGTARGLVVAAALVLAGCGGSSAPKPSNATLHLALPLVPQQLDPAKAADLPSLNVAHELYSGLTRYSGTGVRPDLAQSWDVGQKGLVWTFHLRKGLRWSDDSPIVAGDFRRAWLHALDPKTAAPYAGPYLGIVRGARRFHATGQGTLGVQALDDRTLRVTLQHPVPWFDELVANPVTAPEPPRASADSGPFRLVSRNAGRLVLERNFNYWDAKAVKPARLVLDTRTRGADVVLPRGLAAPGLPWVQTPVAPTGRRLPLLAVELLWLVTRNDRPALAAAVGDPTLNRLVPQAMPGHDVITAGHPLASPSRPAPQTLRLAYTAQDAPAQTLVPQITAKLARVGVTVEPVSFSTLAGLVRAAGPPARSDLDLVLLGWSSKLFDQYNIFDLFPCGSAFNVARWCDPGYDALMRKTVRELDDGPRWRLEREVLAKLRNAMPAVPVAQPSERVTIAPGVSGFSWSPLGFYELMGLTRS